jgi:hypothetical protein
MDTETMVKTRYWVNTVSRDHVLRGVTGGFAQADHGKATRLRRMAKGDRIVFYSPRTELDGGDPLQAFTAIGEVIDDDVHQLDASDDASPWRRQVRFEACREAPVRPLIEQLECIRNKESWGIVFRRGFFEIQEHDFRIIAAAMACEGSSAA